MKKIFCFSDCTDEMLFLNNKYASLDIAGNRINPQLYFFNSDGNMIAYAPYDRFAALIDINEYKYLKEHKIADSNTPADLKIFYKNHYIDKSVTEINKYINELTVFTGDSCNLACSYCFAATLRGGKFDKDKCISGVKIILEKYTTIKYLSFFGNGEPTLYLDVIKDVVKSTSNMVKEYFLTTNGVFGSRTEEIVKFLVENNFYIQLSFDGIRNIQDLQRPLASGGSSYKYIINTINEFKKYGDINKYVYPRFTLTDFSAQNLKAIIKFFKDIGFEKVRFAELEKTGNAEKIDSIYTNQPNSTSIVPALIDAMLFAESLNIDFKGDYIPTTPHLEYSCANMGGSSIAMNKNLELLSCVNDEAEWIIGKVDIENKEIKLQKEKIDLLRNRKMSSFEECTKCPVKCGGGCAELSYKYNKSLNVAGEYREKCDAMRGILAGYLTRKLEI